MKLNKVAIIGVGLIGGSIGLALKRKKIAGQIIGVCRHQESLRRARQIGAIDAGSLDYKEAVREADLVILAAPILQIINIAKRIAPYLKKNCLLTDAGSTKVRIVEALENVLPAHVGFVGAHPLAGSEKRSVSFARADLFEGSLCILTRTKKTKPAALKKVLRFWKQIGCRAKVMSPQKHDRIVASTSHLPHLAATQLVRAAASDLNFAASGFLDTTRIASSEAEIWTDILLTNKKFITQAIDKYIAQLKSTRGLIHKEDRRRLSAEFKKAKSLRDALQS